MRVDMSESARLRRRFYAQDTVKVAKDLLGKMLVRKIGNKTLSGIITETEAYRHTDDPASHAYRRITERNKAMFGRVGHAYVYFTYGMYHCVNVVARSEEYEAGAVLIRSLKPHAGLDVMMRNRKTDNVFCLTNGPAKITIALDITKKQYGEDLVKSNSLYITNGIDVSQKIVSSPRVGIRNATEKMWNFKIDL